MARLGGYSGLAVFCLGLLGGCSLIRARGPDAWRVPCQDAPKLVINTLEDLGYRVTGRFDPSEKGQGVITGKRGSRGAKERVSVVLRCETGLLGRRGDSVKVLPQPIAWRPGKSEFPDQFRRRFAEYVAGTAKPLERPAEPPAPAELSAAFLDQPQVRRDFKVDLGAARLQVARIEVRNLGKRAFLMSADLARVHTPAGDTIVPLSLKEVSNQIARIPIGSGRQIYHDLERAYLGHHLLKPGKDRAGLIFFSRIPQGDLLLPVMDAETGEVRELTASLTPDAGSVKP